MNLPHMQTINQHFSKHIFVRKKKKKGKERKEEKTKEKEKKEKLF